MKMLHRHLAGNLLRRARMFGRCDDAAAVQRLFWLLHEPKHRTGLVKWRARPLRYADAPALYYQLADIFGERVYDFTCNRSDPRILDVGGHIGLASLRFRELFPKARLSVFEPAPSLDVLLRANLAAANDTSTEIINAAAWTADGTRGFNTAGDDSGTLDDGGSLQVATVNLARFCTETIDFLKLDVEGAEFEILSHLSASGSLPHVRRIFLELHEWGPGIPRFHEAINCLVAAGFNYRIRSAGVFGTGLQPAGFTSLAHPANQVALYAWRD